MMYTYLVSSFDPQYKIGDIQGYWLTSWIGATSEKDALAQAKEMHPECTEFKAEKCSQTWEKFQKDMGVDNWE